MKKREYFMIMISIIVVLMFGGCSAGVKKENKNTAFENLDITIEEEKIDFDKFGNDVEIVEKLAKQLEAGNDEYCDIGEDTDIEHMEWYKDGTIIYVNIEKKDNTISQFMLENEENESLKINGMGIGDNKKELEEKWEEEKRKVIYIKDDVFSYDIIVYNNTCDIICEFYDSKLRNVTYEYDATGQTVSAYREKNKIGYEEEYEEEDEEEKKVTYPTEIHLNEKEKQEYARVVCEYEEKYGKYQEEEVRKMSYLKLLDLKNDDTVQLMVGYADIGVGSLENLDYAYDIWDLQDGKAVKVDTGDSIHWDGGLEVFEIVEHEGQKYIVSGDRAPRCDSGLMYHGYKDGKFGIVRYEDIGDDYLAIDGKKVSEAEFKRWKIDATDTISLNYGVDLSDEINQVKEILNMEDNNMRVDEDITKEQYEEYVNQIMIPKYGKIKNIDQLNKSSESFDSENPENWRAQKGIIAIDVEDLNNDGKQEGIVFYIGDQISEDETDEGDSEDEVGEEEEVIEEKETCLRMVILSQQKGKIKESDDIVVRQLFNHSGYFNIQFYTKTNKNQKYIIVQDFGAIDGIGFSFYILSVTKDNKFCLEKGICDPGYTSGVGLYRFDTMEGIDYDNKENVLYETDGLEKSEKYKQKLEKELEEYDLEIENSICSWDYTKEMYVLKKDSTLKLIETMIGGLEIKTSKEN